MLLTFSYVLLEGKVLCLHASASRLWDVYCLKQPIRPCGKNYISGHIGYKSFIKTVKRSFFNQIIVNQSFYGALLTFSHFLLQGKVLCFSTRRQVTCEILIFKCLYGVPTLSKKSISPVKFDTSYKSFIQTVNKCSFFNQIIVYQSFYGAPLAFS